MKRMMTLILLMVTGSSFASDIFDAARHGDLAAIEAYRQYGEAINSQNEDGYTPLLLAAYHGQLAAVQALHRAGADACIVDLKGNSALMGVAFKGDTATAEWLIETAACDVNHQNHAGQTALMMAALFGRESMLNLLLTHQAKADLVDASGNTASSLAQAQGLDRVVLVIKQWLN